MRRAFLLSSGILKSYLFFRIGLGLSLNYQYLKDGPQQSDHQPRHTLGFFITHPQEGGTHKQGCNWVLSCSPEHHQNLAYAPPQPCTGFTRWAVTLKESRGQHPTHHSLT